MKNNSIYEIVVSLLLITLSVLLLNPWGFWMPNFLVMCMLAFVVASFAIFAVFVMREKSVDERDTHHSLLAGRTAFLVGSAVLTLGIIAQSLSHAVDFWLVLALILMIIAKFVTRIWSDRKL